MKGSTNSSDDARRVGLRSAAILGVSAAVIVMTAISIKAISNPASTTACVCNGDTSYNSALPSSHPNNRCAAQAKDLSWATWVTGKSRSNQFHFVDLFELLHGHKERPIDNITPTNSQLSLR